MHTSNDAVSDPGWFVQRVTAQDIDCGRVVGRRTTEGAATEDLVNILVTIRICCIELLASQDRPFNPS